MEQDGSVSLFLTKHRKFLNPKPSSTPKIHTSPYSPPQPTPTVSPTILKKKNLYGVAGVVLSRLSNGRSHRLSRLITIFRIAHGLVKMSLKNGCFLIPFFLPGLCLFFCFLDFPGFLFVDFLLSVVLELFSDTAILLLLSSL